VNNNVSNNWDHFVFYLISAANLSYGYNGYGAGIIRNGDSGNTSLGLISVSPTDPWPDNYNTRGQRDSAIVVPSDMVASADYDNGETLGGSQGAPNPAYLYAYTFTGKHHQGGAVVAYCDAHVEYAKTNRWGAPAYGMVVPNRPAIEARWNNDDQPHANVPYFP
jgi:prepilin-type processing-associated H-X9-DG protein